MKRVLSFLKSRILIGALWALVLSPVAACGEVEGHGGNGETHFLSHCSASCGDGYTCLCGVCTQACDGEGNEACGSGSTCLPTASACGEAPLVCDAGCSETSDCAELGPTYRCEAGRCRVGMRTGNPPPEQPPKESICDGSFDIRFAWNISGGFLRSEDEFLSPHGHEYLLVDGTCRYFVASSTAAPIRSGSLTTAQADELETASGWASVPSWSSHEDFNCPDGGMSRLYVPGATAACSCGCDAGTPPGLDAALDAASALAATYYGAGTPLTGAMRVLAYDADSGVQVPPSQPIFDWPFDWSLASIVRVEIDVQASTLIEDMADLQTFRQLRDQNEAANVTTGIIVIRDSDGETYHLLLRDELPQEVETLAREFLDEP